MNTRCNEIGETAGKIYQTLEKSGAQDAGSLQKETEIKDAALFNQSLGWLAREGNIGFEKKGTSLEVSLTRAEACQ